MLLVCRGVGVDQDDESLETRGSRKAPLKHEDVVLVQNSGQNARLEKFTQLIGLVEKSWLGFF